MRNTKVQSARILVICRGGRVAGSKSYMPVKWNAVRVKNVLSAMDYVEVPVHVQVTDTPSHMPADPSTWSMSNVLKVDGPSGDPTHYMLSIWFGNLRNEALAKKCFKSWGSPGLDPPNTPKDSARDHYLMVGTPTFIDRRQTLRKDHQGKHHLWYTGGYILDYDCQNACLKSAAHVATRLFYNCLLGAVQNAAQFWIQPAKIEPPDVSDFLPSPKFPTEPRAWPSVLSEITNHLRENFSEHEIVRLWMEENPKSRPST